MTPEQRNILKTYVETESGKALLQLIAEREISILAEGYSDKSTTDTQIQKLNKASSLYWVRTLIQDLIKPTKSEKKVDTRKQG